MSENNIQPFFVPLAIIIAGALVAAAVFFSGGISVTGPSGTQGTNEGGLPKVRALDAGKDHLRGDKGAKIVIVEYSDLQCPYCAQFHNTMKQVMDKYGATKQVAWVYRQFPLDSLHPEARPAAIASECIAKAKGNEAFWRFADAIFANQAGMNAAFYESFAGQEGISVADFQKCITDPATAQLVSEDEQEVLSQGARGTPYSVVFKDGKVVGVIPGYVDFANAQASIEATLK
jgi:protein-disulfide isomerase